MASCLLWGGAGVGDGVAARGSEALAAAETAEAAPNAVVDDPEPYVSQKGNFRFRFPGKPQVSEQKSGPAVIHSAMYVASDETTYGVTYTDLKPAAGRAIDPDILLEGVVKGLETSDGWKISSKKAIKLGEYHGRDVTGEVSAPEVPEAGLARTRLFLVGTRLYQIILVGPKSKVSLSDFQKCLDSFELLRAAPAAAETAEAAPNAVRDGLEPYVSQKGKFRFQFPGKPELVDQKAGTTVIHTVVHVDSTGTEYGITYTDLEPASVRGKDADTLLEGGVQGMVKSGGWTVSSKKAIKLGEYHGIDVTGEVKIPGAPEAGLGRTRMFLVGTRLYQVILIGPKSKVSLSDFQKYLESFAVLREAPAVARTSPARPAPRAAAKARSSRQPMVKRASPPGNSVTTRTAPRNAKPAAPATTDDDPGPDPSKPAEIAIEVSSASARLVELPNEGDRRRARGEKFRETAPKGGLLVGVRVGYVKGSKVGSIQPIFQAGASYVKGERKGAPVEGETTVVAKPGYAVGGVNARIGLLVDAFQLVFMKYKDGRLDPKDSYVSAWLGDPSGGNLKNISGDGKIVAGFHGVTNQREVNSLGLVVAD